LRGVLVAVAVRDAVFLAFGATLSPPDTFAAFDVFALFAAAVFLADADVADLLVALAGVAAFFAVLLRVDVVFSV
jgi:hypothetical protein